MEYSTRGSLQTGWLADLSRCKSCVWWRLGRSWSEPVGRHSDSGAKRGKKQFLLISQTYYLKLLRLLAGQPAILSLPQLICVSSFPGLSKKQILIGLGQVQRWATRPGRRAGVLSCNRYSVRGTRIPHPSRALPPDLSRPSREVPQIGGNGPEGAAEQDSKIRTFFCFYPLSVALAE